MPTDEPNYDAVIETPIASILLGIVVAEGALLTIALLAERQPPLPPSTAISREVVRQLRAYFSDPHWRFSLPVTQQGTPFQQRVWQFMCSIPVGETRRYGDAAQALNSAPRAVGGACRRNPVPLVVPCHRIIAANGLGGFNGRRDGAELAFKQWLLKHERV